MKIYVATKTKYTKLIPYDIRYVIQFNVKCTLVHFYHTSIKSCCSFFAYC